MQIYFMKNILINLSQKKKKKKETVQYKVALLITATIKETFHDRLYQELGSEPLGDRRWSR